MVESWNTIRLLFLGIIFIFDCVKVNKASVEKHGCENDKLDCICGIPPNERAESFLLQSHIGKSPDASTARCSSVLEKSEFCESISCSFSQSPATRNVKSKHRKEREVEWQSNRKTMHFPFKFPKACNDTLKPVKNAKVACNVWRNLSGTRRGITCKVKCAYGFALREDGKVKSEAIRTCRETDSSWSPKGTFPICEPFIYCKVVLVKRGNLNCVRSLKFPTYCDISCAGDSKHAEISKRRYECKDDSFSKSLPHCAAVDKNAVLIQRPR